MERCDAELSLKRAHVNYGAALLRIYLFWLKDQEDIIRRIKAGVIVAGAKLNEADLAESMQISRAPVREAFRSLETAGLVRFIRSWPRRPRGTR